MQFRAANDSDAIRLILGSGADNSPAPQALIACDDAGTYDLRALLGTFGGCMEWVHEDDAAVIPETGDITPALACFAPVRPGERLVRIV